MVVYDGYSNTVLHIRRFPYECTDPERISTLFNSLGACRIATFPDPNDIFPQNNIFVEFSNEEQALYMLWQLHQLDMCNGKRLNVELSTNGNVVKAFNSTAVISRSKSRQRPCDYHSTGRNSCNFIQPSTFRYSYPNCTAHIANRIGKLLLNNASFYTQVLHLANMMNLECPLVPEPSSTEIVANDSSQEEELQPDESEQERIHSLFVNNERKASKRRLTGLKICDSTPIKVQISSKCVEQLSQTADKQDIACVGFGTIESMSKTKESDFDESLQIKPFTLQDIKVRRVKNYLRLPVFLNWTPGSPACRRLYIKNLAKQTTTDQLKQIFGAIVSDPNDINVCLMTKGRMRGQAFVALPDLESAKKAIEFLNGVNVNDKVLVIQYALACLTDECQPSVSLSNVSGNWNSIKQNTIRNTRFIKRLENKGIQPKYKDDELFATKPNKPYRVRAVAIDCEMVGVGPDGKDSVLARVSIVDEKLNCLLDAYVLPEESVTDYRTHVSGLDCDILKKYGKPFHEIQSKVSELINKRILVGHSIKHDLAVLHLDHSRKRIRDTQQYKPFRDMFNGSYPSLKNLTAKVLNKSIQKSAHNSIEDAVSTMQLYLSARKEWEDSIQLQRRHFKNEEITNHSKVANHRIKHKRYLEKKQKSKARKKL
ncbi:hypothetical protein GJ496_010406 [Pomphorhynchus laevis]|nr:hypothetical protein GJ496_010406 [Pomphorhynchus laevis]